MNGLLTVIAGYLKCPKIEKSRMNKHIQGAGGVYGQNLIVNIGQNRPIIAEIWEIGLNIKNPKHKFSSPQKMFLSCQ